MSMTDWLNLILHFAVLSMLAVGGAIATVPEMHRYLVTQQGWLSESAFNSSITLAQAAPGPNVLFVALMGWNFGLAEGGPWALWWAVLGACICLISVLLPSSVTTYLITQWAHRNRELRSVRAFKAGMAPLVISLMMSTGWLMNVHHDQLDRDWPVWLVTLITTVVVLKTRIHLLWLLSVGAVLGIIGWV
ncbi:MAG: chromate transporter [Limnohabitans sp.]|jgi:chromate transporter|nr:chromate transporter [Burkholderiaceae bacterium]